MGELKPGERVPLENGGDLEILESLGSGGQGAVYRVRLDGGEYALKWYFANKLQKIAEFRQNLHDNVYAGAPSGDFLWPLHLTANHAGSFGYVMNLRPKEFCDFSAILNRKREFSSLHALLRCAIRIVDAFRELHRTGRSYQDLNDGNFFVNTENGDILICDNDNVAPDKKSLGIAGKPGYMAPEIVRGDARPETLTDNHSLAVVLFKLFIRHDPLMGRAYVSRVCITEEAERELYGTKPVFIFDPDDGSNRPAEGVHPNPIRLWPRYPDYFREAFTRAFCEGMRNPSARLTDNEWRTILIRLRGEIIACDCGRTMFASSLNRQGGDVFQCPKCGEAHPVPMVLDVRKWPVHLFPGSVLYKCHTEDGSDDCVTETGRVTRNKANRNAFGVRNLSGAAWRFTYGGRTQAVEPDNVVPIRDGTALEFGGAAGAVIRKA